ncbi:MAG: bile acid:sodium symporter family transporter [Planctomycetaceae bacterium]
MLQRLLLVWLALLSLIAFYWPECLRLMGGAESPNRDPFLQTSRLGLLKPVIMIAMFAVGSLLPRDEFREIRRRWPTVLGGSAVQYTVMPLLAFGMSRLLKLDEASSIGLMMVGCVPGAMASNVLTLTARGNVSYSVSLTTSATLLSPLIVPLTLKLTLGKSVEIDPLAEFNKLMMLVVGPVILGHGLCRLSQPFSRVMRKIGSTIANSAILWIVATVVGLNRERLGETTPMVLLALLCVNLLGYTAGWLAGRHLLGLSEGMRRALTLEIGMQNAGLGTVLALDLFKDKPAVAIPTAAYTFGCMLTGTILAQIWSRMSVNGNQAAH